MAKRDVAFEAYVSLYRFGLIDDHLLPKGRAESYVDYTYTPIEKRPNVIGVAQQIDLWPLLAEQWQNAIAAHSSMVELRLRGKARLAMLMLLPQSLPPIPDFEVHRDHNTTFSISILPESLSYPKQMIDLIDDVTSLLLRSCFRGKISTDQRGFSARFIPANTPDLRAWLTVNSGAMNVEDMAYTNEILSIDLSLIRDLSRNGAPAILHDITFVATKDMSTEDSMDVDEPQDTYRESSFVKNEKFTQEASESSHKVGDRVEIRMLLEVQRLSKRTDFLHRPINKFLGNLKKPRTELIHADNCQVDNLSFKYEQFAALIPTILHKVHEAMVVDRLCASVFSGVNIMNQSLVRTAITASAACEASNYERLEFLGDSILKCFTSLTLAAGNPRYHEGILSHEKDHIVSNGNLASAAVQAGLPEFIITRSFTGQKWRPPYIDDVTLKGKVKTREMSTKTLADVVEALVGAAYLDGGPNRALSCLKALLPHVPWLSWPQATNLLRELYEMPNQPVAMSTPVEDLIGYEFKLKSPLWEALTHASYHGRNSNNSYQRLEFLGDSLLDIIVTTEAFSHEKSIPTHQLHLIRTALVNANFLGYLALRHSVSVCHTGYKADGLQSVTLTEVSRPFTLVDAIRHGTTSLGIPKARQDCLARYRALSATISHTLNQGSLYPWTALARLKPPKLFSDIIESILGAVYVDSRGSLDACKAFLMNIGLMPYLHRVLNSQIALLHPKEELGLLSKQEEVKYVMDEEGEGARQLTCAILVGEREVARARQGTSAMECQTRAAEAACRLLKRERRVSIFEPLQAQYEVQTEGNKALDQTNEESERRLADLDHPGHSRDINDHRGSEDDAYMTADEW